MVDGGDERADESFVGCGVLEGDVVGQALRVGGDEEDVAGGDGVIFIFGGEFDENFIEDKLNHIHKHGGVTMPGFLGVFTGFEVIDGDGFGLGVNLEVVNDAGEGDARET